MCVVDDGCCYEDVATKGQCPCVVRALSKAIEYQLETQNDG